jgi:hypothetical protein
VVPDLVRTLPVCGLPGTYKTRGKKLGYNLTNHRRDQKVLEMQAWVNKYPGWFGFATTFLMYCAVSVAVSWWSGWRPLARQFGTKTKFTGALWRAQSGQMRWLCSYRGCLTVGANLEGLYLATFPFFPLFHPPLFIPWSEVSAARKHLFPGIGGIRFRLGKELSIPLWIGDRLAERLSGVAGSAYPTETLDLRLPHRF